MFTCRWQALMLTLYKYLGNVQRNLYGLAALGLGLSLYDTKGNSKPTVPPEATAANSSRERGERLSGQRGFRGLQVRGESSRCEDIEIHHGRFHAASENLIAQQIEKIQ